MLKDMEVSTVGGFQGWEKEAPLFYQAQKREVWVLKDQRRMNVLLIA